PTPCGFVHYVLPPAFPALTYGAILSLHGALPIWQSGLCCGLCGGVPAFGRRIHIGNPAADSERRVFQSAKAAKHCRCLQRRSSRSEEHTSELQSRFDLVCRLLTEKKNDAPRRVSE